MLAHYLKTAFRNVWKYKTQSFTGIFGLAFALACFVPVLYWMRYETSYDGFYPGAENIYRIYTMEKQSGKVNKAASRIVEKKMHEQFPAVEASTAIMIGQENCRTENIQHIQMHLLYADSSFFGVFPQVVVSGNARQPLQILNDMVLTETMAVRLFGDAEKAIGQQVQTKMRASLPPYTVTAVVKDPPANSNFSFDGIIVHDMLKYFSELPEEVQWTRFFMDVYVKFNPRADVGGITEQLRDLASRSGGNEDVELRMMPISDVRHKLNADAPFTLNFIGLFVASGILLLFTAIFNFLNLHLDLFRQRSRELHLRSVNGATGSQLVRQMIFELACSILLALLLAVYLLILVRPAFSGLLNITMDIRPLIYLSAVCGIGVMALMLSFSIILFWRLSHMAMRPQSESQVAGQPVLRRVAVTMQLAVSIVFIIAAAVVMMQMRFVGHKDLGFDRDGIIQLSGFTDYSGKVQEALTRKIAALPQVENITDADFRPQHETNPFTTTADVEWEGKPALEKPTFNLFFTDNRFAETFRLKMMKGKWWDEGQAHKIVLNEEAVRVMGLKEPVGSVIRMPSPADNSNVVEYQVAGVVHDFHTQSLRERIRPTLFMLSPNPCNTLYIHVSPGRELDAIQQISAMLPGIDASLADAHLEPIGQLYDRLNRPEQVGLKMFSILAIVCLLISLFGIYAVASASTLRRRKEVAVRKVVGAEARDIIRMFFREYTLQVIIAGAFALPLAYLTMSKWLQGYAYRTDISWWLLVGVITGVVAVVLITVFGEVLRAANSNPAEVVKSE